jgi:hypothetical protein
MVWLSDEVAVILLIRFPEPKSCWVIRDLNLRASTSTRPCDIFQHVSHPDPENAVKEAACAVEATASALFLIPGAKTLGEITRAMTGTDSGKLPKAVAQTFHGLYGFRSGVKVFRMAARKAERLHKLSQNTSLQLRLHKLFYWLIYRIMRMPRFHLTSMPSDKVTS